MTKVIPTDVYDKDVALIRLDFFDSAGEFVFQSMWDPTDEQTSHNRELFRKWAYRQAEQLGYEVAK